MVNCSIPKRIIFVTARAVNKITIIFLLKKDVRNPIKIKQTAYTS
jgi:hypothetical protein